MGDFTDVFDIVDKYDFVVKALEINWMLLHSDYSGRPVAGNIMVITTLEKFSIKKKLFSVN